MTRHEDVRKQQLAAQLFSGVTEKPRLSSGRGLVNKITKTQGKPSETSLKAPDKSNMDLLLDVENSDVCDVAKDDASSLENDLISSLNDTEDKPSSRDEVRSWYSQEAVDSDSCMVITQREQEDCHKAVQKVCCWLTHIFFSQWFF